MAEEEAAPVADLLGVEEPAPVAVEEAAPAAVEEAPQEEAPKDEGDPALKEVRRAAAGVVAANCCFR